MRVISQNGFFDVPYEMAAFHAAGGTIRMSMVGNTGMGTIIAQYSTQEKSLKSLEQVRLILYHTPERVFRFPQEDEI